MKISRKINALTLDIKTNTQIKTVVAASKFAKTDDEANRINLRDQEVWKY
jgi:hypothetical protein